MYIKFENSGCEHWEKNIFCIYRLDIFILFFIIIYYHNYDYYYNVNNSYTVLSTNIYIYIDGNRKEL